MANSSSLFFLLFSFLIILPKNHATFSRSISREEINLKEDNTQTHLIFYFHDVVSGPNPTVVQIARASTTNQSATSFGALAMLDDPLTEGPESTSRLVGRAQGMYGSASLEETVALMVMNFVFLEGDYNGSTVSVLGRNPVNEGVREMPVVGGTGAFRFAKGYAQARTHTFDRTTGDAVVQYDVYVSHASSSTPSGTGSGSGSSPGSGFGSGSNNAPALERFSLSTLLLSMLVIAILYI